MAASSFTREGEQGNLDLLRGTLLSMRSILGGKMLASFMSISGMLAAGFVVVLIAVAVDDRSWRDVSVLRATSTDALVMGVSLFFLLSLATFFSVVSRRTLGALLGTYVTLVLAYIAVPIFLAVLGLDDSGFFAATNPYAAYAMGMDDKRARVDHLANFTLGHGLAGLGLFALAIGLVDRVRGRD